MKRSVLPLLLVFAMIFGVFGMTASADEYTGTVAPQTRYDYTIPAFTLTPDETAYTTRYGYGFSVDNSGWHDRNFKITFNVTGDPVYLKVSLMSLESYSSGNTSAVLSTQTISGAGSQTVKFTGLALGKYVIKWENAGTCAIAVTKGHFDSN